MRVPRIYQNAALNPGEILALSADAFAHLVKALRVKEGMPLIVFNGQGGECSAKLVDVKKEQALIRIEDHLPQERESPIFIHLAQGVARRDNMDFIIQKSVELGVSRITPLFTQYSEVKLFQQKIGQRIKHWQGIIVSACEQSGRNHLPQIDEPVTLESWFKHTKLEAGSDTLKLIFHPDTSKKMGDILVTPTDIQVLIGPEGGFSMQELELAKRYDFLPIKLGPRTLRTETAAVAALTAIQCQWGDLLK